MNYKLLLATAFFMLLIVAYATLQPLLLLIYALFAFFFILINSRVLINMAGIEKNISILLVVVITLVLPISALRNETAILHYLIVFISLGSAYVLTRNLYVYMSASGWSLILIQLIIFVYLYFSGLEGFPLENLLPHSSSNGVTSYLVLLQANYSIVSFILTRRVSLLTSFITLLICIVGYGRGSILAAFFLFFISTIFSISLRSRRRFIYDLFLLAGFLSVLLSFLGGIELLSQIFDWINSNTKLGHGLSDADGRMLMIHDYLNQINVLTFFIGASYQGTSIEQYFNGNPHNSYIRAHHLFGVGYILLMSLMPLVILRRGLDRVVKYFCGLIILIILFRAFTEPIIFPTPFDFFYFSIIFMLCCKSPDGSSVKS